MLLTLADLDQDQTAAIDHCFEHDHAFLLASMGAGKSIIALTVVEELLAQRYIKKVLVLACGSCVTVCLTGGEKQAEELASQLRLAAKADGKELTVDVDSITRQCDKEFFEDLKCNPADYDAVLSIACGVGVGFIEESYASQAMLCSGLAHSVVRWRRR